MACLVTVAGFVINMTQIAEICRRFGVARLDVFGSVGRGEAIARQIGPTR